MSGAGNARNGALLGALLLLVLVTHAPLLSADYVQDDHLAVEENPIVARGNLREIFTSHYWAGASGEDRSLYRPVVIASFAAERAVTGEPSPFLGHAVNLALHAAVTLLLWAWLRRLGAGREAAWIGAVLFAVHPLHTEAIANVVGRAELLAAGGALAALWATRVAASRASTSRARAWLWLGALALFVGLGSKEVAIAAVPLLLLQEWSLRGPEAADRLRSLLRLAPAAVAVLAYLALRITALESWAALQQPHPMDNPLILLGGAERLRTALGLVARTAGLMLYPIPLSIDYSGPVIGTETRWLAWRPLVGLAVLLAASAAVAVAAIRAATRPGGPAARVGVTAALFLFPYLVIGNLLVDVGIIFAERTLYLPSAGFCCLLALALTSSLERSRLPPAIAARGVGLAVVVVTLAFSLLSWQRTTEWRDDVTVFEAAVRAHPESPRANFMLGKAAQEAGRDDEALSYFRRTLELWPDHVPALLEAASLEARGGSRGRAEELLRRALAINPDYAGARRNLGILLRREGRLEEAERELLKSLREEPLVASAWASLGHVRFDRSNYDGAAVAYARAVALGREDLIGRLRESRARAAIREETQ